MTKAYDDGNRLKTLLDHIETVIANDKWLENHRKNHQYDDDDSSSFSSKNGGRARNRTEVHGFAIRCITTLPLGQTGQVNYWL